MSAPVVFRERQGEGSALVEDMDFLICESAEVYQTRASAVLSCHQLTEFRRNPLLYRKKQLGLVRDEDRSTYVIDRAAHVRILEGRQALERQYAFGGRVNPKTGEPLDSRTKAFQEWADAQGKTVLTDEQIALIESLDAAVHGHEYAAALLADGIAEGVIRMEYCGLPCQARLDWLNPQRGIVDLKTCEHMDWLVGDSRGHGYAHRLAFCRALVALVVGSMLPVYLVAVEKHEPFRCGAWRLGEGVLGVAQKENEDAIARLAVCRERDHWPTGYEDVREFDWT